jgi:excisionase family DNA binding protein
MGRLVDPQAFAKKWGVCTQTVYRWIHAGSLKATQLPTGTFRIPDDAIPEPSTGVKPSRSVNKSHSSTSTGSDSLVG